MSASAPAQVFLHDAVHHRCIAGQEFESRGKHHISASVKDARIVPEFHVLAVDDATLSLLGEDHRRLEYISDEHRSLARRLRLEKMQILPDGTANRARDSNVMLQA